MTSAEQTVSITKAVDGVREYTMTSIQLSRNGLVYLSGRHQLSKVSEANVEQKRSPVEKKKGTVVN